MGAVCNAPEKTYGASCTLKINSQYLVVYIYTNHHSTIVVEPICLFLHPEAASAAAPPHGPVVPNNP